MNPRIFDLPPWVTDFRPHQIDAICQAVADFSNGAELVIMDAPTGSGKTLIGETVRQMLKTRGLYVCTTKQLQDQIAEDFPYAAVLKGRANYETWTPEVNAGDCDKVETECSWCPHVWTCPYEVAKNEALKAKLAVLNSYYLLTETNGPGKFSKTDFTIIDEADTLERVMLEYTGIDISPARVEKHELGEPSKVTKQETWADWIVEAVQQMKREVNLGVYQEGVKGVREYKARKRILDDLVKMLKYLPTGDWVYTGKDGRVSFKPVNIMEDGARILWNHSSRFLLMSASIISPSEMVRSLGWPEDRPWTYVEVPSTFPVDIRRIKIMPIADMTKDKYEVEKLAAGIEAILDRHPNDRVLVHTVSYRLAADLVRLVRRNGRKNITYKTAFERNGAIARFRRSRAGVLFAPSLDRGVDFIDDDCRVVIVAKVPMPYIGDRQIAARLYGPGGRTWYDVQTVRTLIQMTGRATRHSTDFSTSYIVDSTMGTMLWSRARNLFPSWWTEAIDWRDNVRL